MTQVPAIPIPRRCEVSQKFFFDAAHTLKRTLDDADEVAGSRRIHGHTYHAEVTVAGSADPDTGMVVDLGHLRNAWSARNGACPCKPTRSQASDDPSARYPHSPPLRGEPEVLL